MAAIANPTDATPMKKLYLFILILLPLAVWAQPRQQDYFHKDLGSNWRPMSEPGDYILSNSVLIGNQHVHSTVSFSLSWSESFEESCTSLFSLEPKFASTFSINEKKGCWIKIITSYGSGEQKETTYFLEKGNCYAIYWNEKTRLWDVATAFCRR